MCKSHRQKGYYCCNRKNHYDVSFSESSFVGALTGRYGMKEIHSKNVFEEYEYINFENKKFMCISAYDIYLKQLYGNYMKLPAENERETHSSIAFWK